MRMRGLEPPRAFAHTDLNRARLPIPPHPRGRTVSARARDADWRTRVPCRACVVSPSSCRHSWGRSCCSPRRVPGRPPPRLDASAHGLAEVVVTLPQPPLAQAILHDRALARATTTRHRLNVRAPASVSYLRTLASAQRSLQARISAAIPARACAGTTASCSTGWPSSCRARSSGALSKIPGATVWPSVTYHELLDRTPKLIGAPTVWGPTLATAGNGHEDRDHRRRARPDAHLLRPDELRLSAPASRRGTRRTRRRR